VTNGDSHRNTNAVLRTRSHLPARSATAEGGPLSSAIANQVPTARAAVAVERARLCARVAEDNKGRDVVILDMRDITPLYDFFILITGLSRRQLHTITEEIDAALCAEGETRISIEGYEAGKWIVQDYGDLVVHVFDRDAREYYALEDLWADAPRVPWA
jgi:ribosome-associated protein